MNIDESLITIGKKLEKNQDDWEAWAAKADILFSMELLDSRSDVVTDHWRFILIILSPGSPKARLWLRWENTMKLRLPRQG